MESPCSEACGRNRGPILEVLRDHFAERRRVLEIGSGTGQHAVHFAAALPQLTWQTSDLESNLSGIRSRLEGSGLPNLPPPIALDVTGAWPDTWFDAAFTANTLHIMGWPEVQTLFAALPEILSADAMLAVYGPFNYNGRFTSPSNAAFDEWLKQHSPHSGIRDFALVDELARSSGFALVEDRPMPANNRTLVWRRAGVRRRKRHYVKKTLATLLVALTGTFCVSPTHASDLRRQVGAYRATHEKDIVTQLDALTPSTQRRRAGNSASAVPRAMQGSARASWDQRSTSGGISSGAVGAAANNAIPTQADISIDFRLVPDQTPEHVRAEVERFLTAKGWTLVSAAPDLDTRLSHPRIIQVGWSSGYPGLRTDLDTPAARALITSARDAAGGRLALVPMMGGSVPLSLFHHILGVPVIILPIVNHDDSQHAPNENLRLKNLWDGIDVYAAEMAELGW